ncbi:MAG: hypothetical protein R2707_05835 [Acidimicrobiales bacterium]
MALRGIAGEMARNTAGIWKVVADVVDPKPPKPAPESVGEPAARDEAVVEATIDVAAGQMLVPIDAWTRILEQVGHVHEAGQQVAEARERAARAETENEFLKEQLRELKAQRGPRRPAAPARDDAPPPAASDATAALSSRRDRLRRARATASRWIGPT